MTKSVITSIRNTTGIIELNRPKALNSLNADMVIPIAEVLDAWRDDDSVSQVLIHAPERSFCAGGDVKAVRDQVLTGDMTAAENMFAEEYKLNLAVAEFPKPYGAIMDGVVMGGGQGLSMHGDYRIITTNAFASMPEMAIGYFTDVGMSWKLQRFETGPAMGRFLALTGYRLKAADLLYTGMATHLVDSPDPERIIEEGFEKALIDARTAPDSDTGEPQLAAWQDDIDAVFGFDTWAEIDEALNNHGNAEFVEAVRELTAAASPSSLVATTELLAANSKNDLRAALENELRFSQYLLRQPDFAEGVRAVLVDKTRDPKFTAAGDPEEYRALLR